MEKESYFTPNNIDTRSMQFMERIRNSGLLQEQQVFDVTGSALLVLDMQNYFLSPNSHAFIPSGGAIIPRINLLINYFRRENRPIIYTRHINKKVSMMEYWWRDLILENTNEAKIVMDLEKDNGLIIIKDNYDAFLNTKLKYILKRKKTSNVVITGVMTHLCCETTARAAFMHNFKVFFPVDTTATYNHNFHEATLLNLAHGFARPVISVDLYGD